MGADAANSAPASVPDAAAVRSAVEKIIRSPHFAQSERMCRFLDFVVDLTLEGRAGELKESVIGVGVFDREPGYDPKSDPIVRVEARRLRAKLEHYYSEEGLRDPVRIELPKGGYVPIFLEMPALLSEVKPVEEPVAAPQRKPRVLILIGAVCALVAVAVAIGIYGWRPKPTADTIWAPQPLTVYVGIEARPSLSPSGDEVAFLWDQFNGIGQQVYIQPVGASVARRLTTSSDPHYSPVWSADGREIAYVRRTESGKFEIYSVPAHGGTPTKWTDFRGEAHFMAAAPKIDLSPDGRYFVFYEREDPQKPSTLYLFDRRTGRREMLTKSPSDVFGDHDPVFSPDGQLICFARSFSNGVDDLYILKLADRTMQRLTNRRTNIVGHAWTPDGKSMIYAAVAPGMPSTLWRMPLSGGPAVRLLGISGSAYHPSISRNGKRLAYDVMYVNTNIWVGDLQTGTARKLLASTVSDSSPQFSPDGSRVAFRTDRTGNDEIWTSDRDGGNLVRLTRFNGPTVGSPRWSPDGKQIAFDSRAKGNPDIYVVPASGDAPPRAVTDSPYNDVVPSWSRDGKWIYFSSNRTGTWQIWKQTPDGPATLITRQGGFNAAESPDGKTLYYVKSRTGRELWKIPVEGGEETKVTDALEPGLWGAWCVGVDGLYLITAVGPGKGADLQLMPWGETALRKLLSLPKLPPPGDAGCSPDPKSKSILYTQRDNANGDLFLIDHFQ